MVLIPVCIAKIGYQIVEHSLFIDFFNLDELMKNNDLR